MSLFRAGVWVWGSGGMGDGGRAGWEVGVRVENYNRAFQVMQEPMVLQEPMAPQAPQAPRALAAFQVPSSICCFLLPSFPLPCCLCQCYVAFEHPVLHSNVAHMLHSHVAFERTSGFQIGPSSVRVGWVGLGWVGVG